MNRPVLQFDFLTDKNNSTPLIFTQPEAVIVAENIQDVKRCFKKVEKAVNNGYYVAGYISYEATYALYDVQQNTVPNKLPLLWFGVFQQPTFDEIDTSEQFSIGKWNILETKEKYNESLQLIKDAIYDGVTEQVNYTVQFEARFNGDGFTYYNQLKNAQRAKYNAYLDIGAFQILSASPELFFQINDGVITVKPMKGTIHRGKTFAEDNENKRWLQTSHKNREENKLITQLMKNELEKVAHEETIDIKEIYKVEKYPTVFQMTSTITGNVLPHMSTIDILKQLFPAGSISGIPKRETLQLISELESYPREVYCGAIGYITPENNAVFNVPIRTATIDINNHIIRYGSGGAITKHSIAEEEYKEVLTKTKILNWQQKPFQLLETFGLYDGKYLVFDEHIQRLNCSAKYFDFDINLLQIKERLLQLASKYQNGTWRVRLLVYIDGNCQLEIEPLRATINTKVQLANQPINKENIFLYHKTTNRTAYEKLVRDNVFDVLLWNEKDEVTEFTIGNIVVEINGELLTPPVQCGLLPGTFREMLLQAGKVKEEKIYKNDLRKCSNIWLINSVRKWVKVSLHT